MSTVLPYTCFTVRWYTSFLAQDTKQKKKSAPGPLRVGSDMKLKIKAVPG